MRGNELAGITGQLEIELARILCGCLFSKGQYSAGNWKVTRHGGNVDCYLLLAPDVLSKTGAMLKIFGIWDRQVST